MSTIDIINRSLDFIYDKVLESSIKNGDGGPFGALVLKGKTIVGIGVNQVILRKDPTAHAEIQAIRNACRTLNTYDLKGCELYATGYPCPMCMSAIIWANIKKVYYSADYKDAEKIGFRDSFIYHFIKNGNKDDNILQLVQIDKDRIINLYNKFENMKGTIY